MALWRLGGGRGAVQEPGREPDHSPARLARYGRNTHPRRQRTGKPFLGICVGMQLLADSGEEHGTHQGLGWISGQVRRLAPQDRNLKIPHMGWSALSRTPQGRAHKALAEMEDGAQAYFVHSYYFDVAQNDHLLATCDYGGRYAAIIGRDTILGTQFHPEKSQQVGLAFLRYFLQWKP